MRRWRLAAALAGAAALAAAGLTLHAQPASSNQTSSDTPATPPDAPPDVPVIEVPPEPTPPPAPPEPTRSRAAASNSAAPASNELAGKPPPPPPPPPVPIRSGAAILQVLDKVTAETMRFAAPVGQRVRYKNVVFTVKACETTGLGEPAPRASAYLVVESQPLPIAGRPRAPTKQIFKGWMFANSPGLHPLQHPIYDAWLIACMATAPPA